MNELKEIRSKKILDLSEIEKCILYTALPRSYDRDYIDENKAAAELTMMEAQNAALVTVNDELHEQVARITAELKTKDEQIKAVTALINEWRFIAIERPMPTDRAIGYETCADELQAALAAALKQSS